MRNLIAGAQYSPDTEIPDDIVINDEVIAETVRLTNELKLAINAKN